jgi:hypothetical protein
MKCRSMPSAKGKCGGSTGPGGYPRAAPTRRLGALATSAVICGRSSSSALAASAKPGAAVPMTRTTGCSRCSLGEYARTSWTATTEGSCNASLGAQVGRSLYGTRVDPTAASAARSMADSSSRPASQRRNVARSPRLYLMIGAANAGAALQRARDLLRHLTGDAAYFAMNAGPRVTGRTDRTRASSRHGQGDFSVDVAFSANTAANSTATETLCQRPGQQSGENGRVGAGHVDYLRAARRPGH